MNIFPSDQLFPIIKIDFDIMSEMVEEICNSGYPFKPSEYWDVLNRINIEQLNTYGLNNFKRTVNQNYYNWIPNGFGDNQVKSLISYWAKDPGLMALNAKMKIPRFFNSIIEPENPFLKEENAEIYRIFVGLLWHYTEKTDHYKIGNKLSEPELGNAIQIESEGRLISQDLANSIRERNANYDFFDKNPDKTHLIAELGAGCGRLGHVFLETTKCKYHIFDIPPALMVSQWYLSNLMHDKKVFKFRRFNRFEDVRNEIELSDIGFFTSNQLELFPEEYFDSLISVSSLHEMTAEQVDAYKKIIQKKVGGTVYFKQWINSRNPYLEKQLEKAAYMLDENWELAIDRIDAIQDQFFEILFCRKS